jgi:DNA-binding XRE family transcriptional regulator
MNRKYKNNVAERRKSVGKTQKRLAGETGVSEVSIQNIEYGECAPTIYLAKKIAAALGATVDELFPAG